MLTEIEKVLPSEIEKRSFEIIAEELGIEQLIPGNGIHREKMYPYER